jgi:putative flavoprotein involved in K+ transport
MNKTVGSRLGRRLRSRDTLIGSSNRRARRRGIDLHTRARSAAGTEVVFDDGSRLAVDAVIWATGFDTDHSWIDVPVFDPAGRVVHDRGVTASPGLYFLGLPWLHTRGSALLGWVKDDAEHLARRVASVATAMPPRRDTPNPTVVARLLSLGSAR